MSAQSKLECAGIVRARIVGRRMASLPHWRGWSARRYGPNARYRIPRMPLLFWHMEGRAFFKARAGDA